MDCRIINSRPRYELVAYYNRGFYYFSYLTFVRDSKFFKRNNFANIYQLNLRWKK